MCSACEFRAAFAGSPAFGSLTGSGADAARMARVLGAVLADGGITVQAGGPGGGLVLRVRGAARRVTDLAELWPAVEAMSGLAVDPLSPGFLLGSWVGQSPSCAPTTRSA